MLSQTERKMILEFLGKHADGDVLIQAANRVASNLTDVEDLRKFISDYKPSLHPGDYVGTRVVQTGGGEPIETPATPAKIDKPEDLGPVPSKLGSNGQAIKSLMARTQQEYTVEGLAATLRIPKSTVKPMLALLLERNIVKRVSNHTYQINEPQ